MERWRRFVSRQNAVNKMACLHYARNGASSNCLFVHKNEHSSQYVQMSYDSFSNDSFGISFSLMLAAESHRGKADLAAKKAVKIRSRLEADKFGDVR